MVCPEMEYLTIPAFLKVATVQVRSDKVIWEMRLWTFFFGPSYRGNHGNHWYWSHKNSPSHWFRLYSCLLVCISKYPAELGSLSFGRWSRISLPSGVISGQVWTWCLAISCVFFSRIERTLRTRSVHQESWSEVDKTDTVECLWKGGFFEASTCDWPPGDRVCRPTSKITTSSLIP